VEAEGWGPWSVKADVQYAHAPARALERVVALRQSLDDSTLDNGSLRVLPGTHTRGVLTDDEVATLARAIEPVDCCIDAGGLVVMRPLTVHASCKAVSGRPRRVLHVEYAESLEIAPGVTLAVV
jgi:ectoine hydroxylase-related dioxygenase (phytanoyl-CoA dioxygenase family)